MPGARCLIAIKRLRTKGDKTSSENAYFISSFDLSEKTPQELFQLIRGHWGSIEIRNHWIRDSIFGEDRCRSKNPTLAANMALIRCALLKLIYSQSQKSKELSEACSYDPQLALSIISSHL